MSMGIVRKAALSLLVSASMLLPAYAIDAKEAQSLRTSDLMRIIVRNESGRRVALEELWARADAGRADAMFWRGWWAHQLLAPLGDSRCRTAVFYEEVTSVATNERIKMLWEATAAMELLGEMHEKGVCAEKSKYIAADWYIRAAAQSLANGSRSKSLTMMEKALNLVPDHPQALKLRESLLQ